MSEWHDLSARLSARRRWPGSGPARLGFSGKRLPLSRTIVRFLIQVKAATDAKSNSNARMLRAKTASFHGPLPTFGWAK
jgi:hypothetical protein